MKHKLSFIACLIIIIPLLFYRISYPQVEKGKLIVTSWDAFGYYMYLPSIFIYHDVKELKWLPEMDNKYSLTGGKLYQSNRHKKTGFYVNKYYGGVALIQMPFFAVGHIIAKSNNYAADGFSPPYQYSIAFGAILIFFLSLFLLRKILLWYFSDFIVAFTILLVALATNAIQYVSVDNAMSHVYIFPLYVLIIYYTAKWHNKPKKVYAAAIGFIIGLAAICRATDAIMFLVPILWNTHTKEQAKLKWNLVRENINHLYWAFGFGILAMLPQFIYWQITTGFFIYDVGTSWDFLTPHLQVLFGGEKGWFIYTPVTLFFIAGFFFMKDYPFKKAVIFCCLINMYVIISWRDWHYGASYSCRALVQSYPLFALSLASFIHYISLQRWKILFYLAGLYLIFVNLFQLKQYDEGVIHYYIMNYKYYSAIYLDPLPSPIDMSLLDTKEILRNEKKYKRSFITNMDSIRKIDIQPYSNLEIYKYEKLDANTKWLKIETQIYYENPLWETYLNSEIMIGDSIKHDKIRLNNAITPPGKINSYAFYVKVPEYFEQGHFKAYIYTGGGLKGYIKSFAISAYKKY